MSISKLGINWATFEVCNADKRTAFEDMCAWLFNERFFDGTELLHSDPNNPGVEVMPVLDPKSGKRISYQAKYFDRMDYTQILHSCRTTITYYAGKIDVLYLYCNKDVSVESDSYKEIVKLLFDNNITIIPITNRTILQDVMKNDLVAWYYFNQISFTPEVLRDKLEVSFASLGPRYNKSFNVGTITETNLDYFLCNESAIQLINDEKNKNIDSLKDIGWRHSEYKKIAEEIWAKTNNIEDITVHTVQNCFEWKAAIKNSCFDEFIRVDEIIKRKKIELTKAYEEKNNELSSEIQHEINKLQELLYLPEKVSPSVYNLNLIKSQVIVVNGEAGVGKSQLFANACETLIRHGKATILLLGGSFGSEQQISVQTAEILNMGLSFDELLIKLEGYAVKNHSLSYVFIDALNESTHKNIWRSGLQTLIQELKKYPHIKLALSVRDGYEEMVFCDSIKEKLESKEIARIIHRGFTGESVTATKMFLNYYGIPFLPTYYLQQEMRNPLFLTLFCKTYSGADYDIFTLFEKLANQAEREAMQNCAIKDYSSVIGKLLYEIADVLIKNNSHTISQNDLFSLDFWGVYGLQDKKLSFVTSLCKSGLLLSYAIGINENYQLGYNLMHDFVCAKSIVAKFNDSDELVNYLCDSLLKINSGRIASYGNIDICIVAMGLWAEQRRYELLEMVISKIEDQNDRDVVLQHYLMSFVWRKASTINKDEFLKIITSYPVNRLDVFRVLIENATREHHPLNAMFLHEILIDKNLVDRDYLWTICINDLADDEERLFQLVLHFDEGNTLDGLSRVNTDLLLTLFVWFFTSSNRYLRDKAAKATIELLKDNFDMCLSILKRFENVNDPYVLQRLYGAVFGACTRCQNLYFQTYKQLAKYIYSKIFDQTEVYPDVLLRDYARLILEKYIFEYPKEHDFIDKKSIVPPYNSIPIPTVNKQEYYKKESVSCGFNRIDYSMRIDHPDAPGMYGDFGRYVFQSAFRYFPEVDLVNLYHYAMQFIRDELGYTNELFGQYDSRGRVCYSRNQTKKIERIGKKYQWIAMYNLLARVSDHYLMKEWDEESHEFCGPWNPYVRDFDPTLNRNLMCNSEFSGIIFPENEFEFLLSTSNLGKKKIEKWTAESTPLFSSAPIYLQYKDNRDNEWCALYFSKEYRNREYNYNSNSVGIAKNSQAIWMIAEGLFLKKTDFEMLKIHSKEEAFNANNLPEGQSIYQLFNREYAWSPAYQDVFDNTWLEYEIESGEYRTETIEYELPDFEHVEYDENGNVDIPMVKKTYQKKIPVDSKFIKVTPAYSYFMWEEEYDASQEETTYFNVPCGALIKSLNLKQKTYDGFFYSPNNELVAFDYRLTGGEKCLLFRTDYLKAFLEKEELCLCWKCIGEKQFFLGNNDQIWTKWQGLAYFDGERVQGEMRIKEGE